MPPWRCSETRTGSSPRGAAGTDRTCSGPGCCCARHLYDRTGAAELFCDESRFVRRGATPGRIQRTLLGRGGVKGLDDEPHRHRKAMFMSALTFMLVMYWLEHRGPRFILGFAFGCLLSSVYGSLRARGRSACLRPSGV